MQQIATSLGELDPSSRARVLHWLLERFPDEATTIPTAAPAFVTVSSLRVVPPPVSASDELLSVETLEDLFDPRVANSEAAAAAAAAPQSITGMLNEFVTEFQEIAREWDDASSVPADGQTAEPALPIAS